MDGYSLSDIQEYVLKKYWEKPIYPSLRIYINIIENRITFKI